jgi:preprotein translocase subunit SecD
MPKRRFALFAVLLLLVPSLACSALWSDPSDKWHVVLEIDPSVSNRAQLLSATAEMLRSRLNQIGLSGSSVEIDGQPESGRLRVNLPEVSDRERLKNLLTSQGTLQIVHILSDPNPIPARTYETKEDADRALNGIKNSSAAVFVYVPQSEDSPTFQQTMRWVLAEVPPVIDNKVLRDANAVPASVANQYEISFSLTTTGALKFRVWTAANINQYIGVVLNNEVKSIAYIKSPITDTGIISGNFTKESAEDLAVILKSGALPVPVRIVEE